MRYIIGRARESDICINDNSVSRKHATIIEEGGKTYVEDHNSTNGTFINGRKVYGKELLSLNDILKVGSKPVPFLNYLKAGKSSKQININIPTSVPKINNGKKIDSTLIYSVSGIAFVLIAIVSWFIYSNSLPQNQIIGEWECEDGCDDWNLDEIHFEKDDRDNKFKMKFDNKRKERGEWEINKRGDEITLEFDDGDDEIEFDLSFKDDVLYLEANSERYEDLDDLEFERIY
jgi:pSer/pThr/pTyr-binding forkhead associated (FHA) protein